MVAIDDIHKLAPDLLKKSKAQLEREITERHMALAEIEREEMIKEKESIAAEINRHVEMALKSVKFLKANGHLPDRIVTAFSRGEVFNPTSFLKTVTPESLVSATLAKPRRARMTAAEREAAIAAGTYKPRRRRTKAEMEAAKAR
jgi:hypothetical protein